MDAMTVGELIKELKRHDPDKPVGFAYNYGDHSNTLVCGEATIVEEQPVQYSGYHLTHKIASASDVPESGEDESTKLWVVIS